MKLPPKPSISGHLNNFGMVLRTCSWCVFFPGAPLRVVLDSQAALQLKYQVSKTSPASTAHTAAKTICSQEKECPMRRFERIVILINPPNSRQPPAGAYSGKEAIVCNSQSKTTTTIVWQIGQQTLQLVGYSRTTKLVRRRLASQLAKALDQLSTKYL